MAILHVDRVDADCSMEHVHYKEDDELSVVMHSNGTRSCEGSNSLSLNFIILLLIFLAHDK